MAGSPVWPPGVGSPIKIVVGPDGINYGPTLLNIIRDPTQGALTLPVGNHNPNGDITSFMVVFGTISAGSPTGGGSPITPSVAVTLGFPTV